MPLLINSMRFTSNCLSKVRFFGDNSAIIREFLVRKKTFSVAFEMTFQASQTDPNVAGMLLLFFALVKLIKALGYNDVPNAIQMLNNFCDFLLLNEIFDRRKTSGLVQLSRFLDVVMINFACNFKLRRESGSLFF